MNRRVKDAERARKKVNLAVLLAVLVVASCGLATYAHHYVAPRDAMIRCSATNSKDPRGCQEEILARWAIGRQLAPRLRAQDAGSR